MNRSNYKFDNQDKSNNFMINEGANGFSNIIGSNISNTINNIKYQGNNISKVSMNTNLSNCNISQLNQQKIINQNSSSTSISNINQSINTRLSNNFGNNLYNNKPSFGPIGGSDSIFSFGKPLILSSNPNHFINFSTFSPPIMNLNTNQITFPFPRLTNKVCDNPFLEASKRLSNKPTTLYNCTSLQNNQLGKITNNHCNQIVENPEQKLIAYKNNLSI